MDVIVRYLVAGGRARVVVVVATDLVREAARRHDATVGAAMAMGRAATAGLLLATLTKGDERVTLQVLGDGPLGALTVDAKADGTARVFVKNPWVAPVPATATRPSLGSLVGRVGVVSVVRDLGLAQAFRGQTSIFDGEIDTDVERYLLDSEQIDSALGCETVVNSAGGIELAVGILVQALPGSEGSTLVAAARERLRAGLLEMTWSATGVKHAAATGASATGGNATDTSAADTSPAGLAHVVLGEDAATLEELDVRPIRFHCPCSRERAAATLALLGEHDLLAMIEEDGQARVTCEFCRAAYDFSDEDLDNVRRRIQPHPGPEN